MDLQIDEETITEYKKRYEEETGTVITRDEAKEYLRRLVRYFELLGEIDRNNGTINP